MSRFAVTPIPLPTPAYDVKYMEQLIRTLNHYFRQLENPGPVIASGLQLTNLPTSSVGLPSGTVWQDTGAGNVLKVVP